MPDELCIQDGDRIVTGRFCYRSRRTIQVEITSSIYPFRLTTTMHVSESQSPGGLLGDKGLTNGLELLRKLNRLCRHLEKNRASLLAGYLDFTSFVSRAEFVTWLSDHLFERVCASLEGERKNGEITQEEYGEKRAEAEEQNCRYHRGYRALRKEFFSHMLPFALEEELQDQVLAWLRWEDLEGREGVIRSSRS